MPSHRPTLVVCQLVSRTQYLVCRPKWLTSAVPYEWSGDTGVDGLEYFLCVSPLSGMYCLWLAQRADSWYRLRELALLCCRLAACAKLSLCRISTVESGSPNSRTTCRRSWCVTAGALQHVNLKARWADLLHCSSCSRRFMAPHVSSSGTADNMLTIL